MPIEISGLNYTYMGGSSSSVKALRDISLTVHEGEFLGLIGHTGSGKSTLVQLMCGLIQPESGSVKVDGLDMADKATRKKARALTGLVFQYPEYQLFEETVALDVAYGPKNLGLSEQEVRERVTEAMELVGLPPEHFSGKSPFELSGGEKRRAALAGMVAMRPKYLILDEPMAGLDPSGRNEILDMIDSLRIRTGSAVVMVSHSMDDMAKRAERIAVLCSGALALDGTPAEVFGDPVHMVEMGLDVPTVSRLALALNERGFTVPRGIYSMDEMQSYLLGRLTDA